MTTPATRSPPITTLYTPQWSRRMKADKMRVKAGLEKKMAVQSPIGSLSTDSNIESSKNPPIIAWAAILHLVGRSLVPSMLELVHQMMGSMSSSWARHLTNNICQADTAMLTPANFIPTLLQ